MDFIHKHHKFFLIAILCTACFVRITVILLFPVLPTSDALEYHLLAQNLIAGKGYALSEYSHANFPGTLYAYRPPAFPFILALVYALSNNSIFVAQLLQTTFEILQCFLLYVLGSRLCTQFVGLLSAFLWAFYPASIIQSTLLMPEPLFGCLFLGSLTIIFSESFPRTYSLLIIGILWGLATLTKPFFIIAPLILCIWMIWRKFSFKETLQVIFIVVLVMGLLITPWVFRNMNVLGVPTIVTNAGINLWIGNNEQASGGFRFYPENNPLLTINDEVERDKTAATLAWKYIASHPITFVSFIPKKFAYLFSSDSPYIFQIAQSLYGNEVRSYAQYYLNTPLVSHLLVNIPYVFLIAAGILGFLFFPAARKNELLLILLFVLFWLLLHGVFYGVYRYRYPLLPLFTLAAAYVSMNLKQVKFRDNTKKMAFFFFLLAGFVAVITAEFLTAASQGLK